VAIGQRASVLECGGPPPLLSLEIAKNRKKHHFCRFLPDFRRFSRLHSRFGHEDNGYCQHPNGSDRLPNV
jgi:hypothetical protein